MTSITLPCGCELTLTHVVAMCFKHDHELVQLERTKQSASDKEHAEFMKRIDEALRPAPRREAKP